MQTSPPNKKLDQIDLQMIAELEINSRQNMNQLAKKLDISRQLARYRLQSIEKRELIKSYFTVINFTMFGYTLYRTKIRFSNITAEKQEAIVSYLMKHPNIHWLSACGGKWDLIATFMAANILQYDHFLKELKGMFPQQIQNYDILTTVDIVDFGHDYLLHQIREVKKLYWFGHEFKLLKIDEIDLKILDLLSENARLPFADIARNLKIEAGTVIKRIKAMEKKGIIVEYRALINLLNTPYSSYKLLIRFQNITEQKKDEIIDNLKTDPRVIAIMVLIGQWDFDVEFAAESEEDRLGFVRNFTDQFKDVINDFEVIPLYQEYKFNFFPRDLLQNPKILDLYQQRVKFT